MIRINDIFGTIVVIAFIVGTAIYGLRTHSLMRPPSQITQTIATSLMEQPQEWRLGGETVFYNDTRGLVIQRFGGDGSIKVTRNHEVVPTLSKNMNILASDHNQNYLGAAMRHWLRATEGEREARMIQEVQYGRPAVQ